jgi:hypothetical protein
MGCTSYGSKLIGAEEQKRSGMNVKVGKRRREERIPILDLEALNTLDTSHSKSRTFEP